MSTAISLGLCYVPSIIVLLDCPRFLRLLQLGLASCSWEVRP